MTLIQQLCREIISYAEKRPLDVEIQRIAAAATTALLDGSWQPIELAPADGFFLVHEDGAIRTMMRIGGRWEFPGIPVMITEYGDRLTSPEIERAYGRKLEISDCIYEPTHWMPLPESPEPVMLPIYDMNAVKPEGEG